MTKRELRNIKRREVKNYCRQQNIPFEEIDNHIYIKYCGIDLFYDYGDEPISLKVLRKQIAKYPVLNNAMNYDLITFVPCEDCEGCAGW